jgi:hypothetical protein
VQVGSPQFGVDALGGELVVEDDAAVASNTVPRSVASQARGEA